MNEAPLRAEQRFPRVPNRLPGDDWIIEPAFLKRVKDQIEKAPHFDIDLEQIEEVLLALERMTP